MKPISPTAPLHTGAHSALLPSGRRRVLRGLAGIGVLAASSGLPGCGFALRQAPSFAFDSLLVTGLETTAVSRGLQQAMVASGIRVLNASSLPAPAATTQVVLLVLQDQHERVVAGQTNAGQVRELTLRGRFKFRLSTPAGKYLIEDTELLLERDISFSETAVLAKAAEEAMLFRDMDSDIVQQVLRRLAAVRSL
jgi:LPS-assembly lipoprotein